MSDAKIALLARLDVGRTGGGRSHRLARVLAEAGHDVTLVALGAADGETYHGIRLRCPERTAPPVGAFGYVRDDPQLGPAAEKLRPDLIIATDPPTLRQAVEVSRRTGARAVYDSWELYADQVEQTVPHRWFRPLLVAALRRSILRTERRALPRLAGVILTSEGHREVFTRRHRGRLPSEIALVRNVPRRETPASDDHLRRETGIPEDDRILVYAGSLGPSRGLHELLETARRLPRGHHVVIMGFGWLFDELNRDAPENVHLLPPVPEERLISVLAGADVGLLPIEAGNLSKQHSLANKLFEYLMAGLPVLATDLPEHRRVLDGTAAGVLVPDVSPESLLDGIETIAAAEREEPGAMREAARRLAIEGGHHLEAEGPVLVEFVERCLVRGG